MAIGAILGRVLSSVAKGASKMAKAGAQQAKVAAKQKGQEAVSKAKSFTGSAVTPNLTGITSAFEKATQPLNNVAQAFNQLGTIMTATIAPVRSIGDSLASFVSQSNPALVKQYMLAVDGVMAEIGRAVEPLLRIVTDVAKLIGKAMTYVRGDSQFQKAMKNIQGSLMKFGEILGKLTIAMGPKIVSVMARLIEYTVTLAEQIGLLAESAGMSMLIWVADKTIWVVNKIAQGLSWLMKQLMNFWQAIGNSLPGWAKRLLGITGKTSQDKLDEAKKLAPPMPTHQAGYTSLSSVLKKLDTATFGYGKAKEDPAKKTAENTGIMAAAMELILESIKQIKIAATKPTAPTAPGY